MQIQNSSVSPRFRQPVASEPTENRDRITFFDRSSASSELYQEHQGLLASYEEAKEASRPKGKMQLVALSGMVGAPVLGGLLGAAAAGAPVVGGLLGATLGLVGGVVLANHINDRIDRTFQSSFRAAEFPTAALEANEEKQANVCYALCNRNFQEDSVPQADYGHFGHVTPELAFVEAPDRELQGWMLENGKGGTVSHEEVVKLADLSRNSPAPWEAYRWLDRLTSQPSRENHIFKSRLSEADSIFLRTVNAKDTGDPNPVLGGKDGVPYVTLSEAEAKGPEAVAALKEGWEFNRCRGLKDSQQARQKFPQKP